MMDLKGLREFMTTGVNDDIPHVVIPLLGRFKGEDYERFHILIAPNVTDSGFEVRKWIEWLIESKASKKLIDGPAFSDKEGYVLSQQPFNDELAFQLKAAKENFPDLFPVDLNLDKISTSRSFRKGSTSRAQDLQLDTSFIDSNNRWRAFEKAAGSRPSFKLRDHYLSTRLMARKILAYPQAM